MTRTADHRVVRLPNAPVLVAGLREAAWLAPSGEFKRVSHKEAAAWVGSRPPLLCHAPATARRLGIERFPAFDLLELFAFARPAQFSLPTPRGLAMVLELPQPADLDDEAAT
ncbi:MAG: ATP-dependent DNA helicase, partial [Dongiaceae bacterium]